MSGGTFATIKAAGKGGDKIVNHLSPRDRLNKKLMQAAIRAVERLQRMVRDETVSNGDVIKAASLILDRLPKENGNNPLQGDYEIIVKEQD